MSLHKISLEERKGELFIFSEAVLWSFFPIVTVLTYSALPSLASLAWSTLFAAMSFGALVLYRKTWRELFPKVVGLKMFAGHSVGDLGIIKEDEQRLVYQTLAEEGYTGVLAVHCEKESLLRPNLWNSLNPRSHSYARPNESEVESVRDQIDFAIESQFKGILHIAHISVPESVRLVDIARQENNIRVSCGLTPHHCLLSYEFIRESKDGLIYKVNPPLRDKGASEVMLEYLLSGEIDFIETDHAPHTLEEKTSGKYMSGFPGLPYYPHFIKFLIFQ